MTAEVHISSLVVYCANQAISQTKQAILKRPNSQIFGENEHGKLVVVLEADTPGVLCEEIERIQSLPHVHQAVLVYHQITPNDDSLDQLLSHSVGDL
ncbi:Chaperone NapD [Vibrio stylophorae]|uniref:Chaperone NapD n=1 Tax=Vibrio stylophorae TaxID=659351 RepID=A0ABM8ZRG9_9VIBR|nr:chaperone NapD [Vibrio stylophorae]CAH0532890.1 Chaperone NapD [Vibrio stylophorae]